MTRAGGGSGRARLAVALTLVVGAVLLWVAFAAEPGSLPFYLFTAAVAVAWTAGALLAGSWRAGYLRAGRELSRPVVQPVLAGLLLVAVFAAGAVVVAQVPPLAASVEAVLARARADALPAVALLTVLNGVAEELFFRGALFGVVGDRHPLVVATVAYALVTVVTGNVMLVFAAAVLGLVVGFERRASGGVLAPVLTHVTWSLGMLLVLPSLLSAPA